MTKTPEEMREYISKHRNLTEEKSGTQILREERRRDHEELETHFQDESI